MKRIHIVGGKNHGKTTLLVELLRELSARGVRVGTIKHTHHEHELDLPGKDSYRHREAGAAVAGILSRSMNAAFWPPQHEDNETSESRYTAFESIFAECHLVLVEGDSRTQATKLEVWRKTLHARPLASTDPSIHAVVSHDTLPNSCATPLWPRGDIVFLANQLLALVNARV